MNGTFTAEIPLFDVASSLLRYRSQKGTAKG